LSSLDGTLYWNFHYTALALRELIGGTDSVDFLYCPACFVQCANFSELVIHQNNQTKNAPCTKAKKWIAHNGPKGIKLKHFTFFCFFYI